MKYKHNKKTSIWRRTHGKIAAATTVTGCCAVGYIVSMALASPVAVSVQPGTGGMQGSTSAIIAESEITPTPSSTPAPDPSEVAAEAARKSEANNKNTSATPNPTATPAATPTPFVAGPDLHDAAKKEIAMRLVSSAENSSLNWKAQYAYIEDIGDGRGYTAGIIGFCSGTGDMLELVQRYTAAVPTNVLASYIPALQAVNGTSSHAGLDPGFTAAWASAATDTAFQQAQNNLRDDWYFNPAVSTGKSDGIHALGQFIYYDAYVMHGQSGFVSIRAAAMAAAQTPAQGGDETAYLHKFLDARKTEMLKEVAHSDTSRVDTAQRVFLNKGNLNLNTPLTWSVYGDSYTIN